MANLIIYPLASNYNSMIYYSGLSKIGAIIAQLVEHFLGKEEVGSSILLDGSIRDGQGNTTHRR